MGKSLPFALFLLGLYIVYNQSYMRCQKKRKKCCLTASNFARCKVWIASAQRISSSTSAERVSTLLLLLESPFFRTLSKLYCAHVDSNSLTSGCKISIFTDFKLCWLWTPESVLLMRLWASWRGVAAKVFTAPPPSLKQRNDFSSSMSRSMLVASFKQNCLLVEFL